MWKKLTIFISAFLMVITSYILLGNQTSVFALDPCTQKDVYNNLYVPYTHLAGSLGPEYFFSQADSSEGYLYNKDSKGSQSPKGDFEEFDSSASNHFNNPDQFWQIIVKLANDKAHCDISQTKNTQGTTAEAYFKQLFTDTRAHDIQDTGGAGKCGYDDCWKSLPAQYQISGNDYRRVFGYSASEDPYSDGGIFSKNIYFLGNKTPNTNRWQIYLSENVQGVENQPEFGPLPGIIPECKVSNIQSGFNKIKGDIVTIYNNDQLTDPSSKKAAIFQRFLALFDVNSTDGSDYVCNINPKELKTCSDAIYNHMADNNGTVDISSVPECGGDNNFTSVNSGDEKNMCKQTNKINDLWKKVEDEVNKNPQAYRGDTTKLHSTIARLNNNSCIVDNVCLSVFDKALNDTSPNAFPDYGGSYTCVPFTHEIDLSSYNYDNCGSQSYASVGQKNEDTSSKCCVEFNPQLNLDTNVINDSECGQNGTGCTSGVQQNANSIAQQVYKNATNATGGLIGFCRNDPDSVVARKGILLDPYNEPQDSNQCRCRAESYSQSAKLYCNRYIASSIVAKAGCRLIIDSSLFGSTDRLSNLDYDTEDNGTISYHGELITPANIKNVGPTPIADCPNGSVLTASDIKKQPEYIDCVDCVGKGGGIPTALGCIKTGSFQDFIETTVLGWGIGLAGISALLCIIFSAIQLQLSQGNPERIKKTQEMLTSCITGLILIIFSVFILKFIGVDILRIPGLGK